MFRREIREATGNLLGIVQRVSPLRRRTAEGLELFQSPIPLFGVETEKRADPAVMEHLLMAVQKNRIEPSLQAAGTVESAKAFPRLNQSFLHQIFGLGRVPAQPERP
jgi:hypothetical protein